MTDRSRYEIVDELEWNQPPNVPAVPASPVEPENAQDNAQGAEVNQGKLFDLTLDEALRLYHEAMERHRASTELLEEARSRHKTAKRMMQDAVSAVVEAVERERQLKLFEQ